MSNLLNKDRNKIKDKDEIHTAQEVLILPQVTSSGSIIGAVTLTREVGIVIF